MYVMYVHVCTPVCMCNDDTFYLFRYESTADGNVYISLDDFLPKLEAYR